MSCNKAETRWELIDPVLRAKGYREWRIKLETLVPVEQTGNKGHRRAGPLRALAAAWPRGSHAPWGQVLNALLLKK